MTGLLQAALANGYGIPGLPLSRRSGMTQLNSHQEKLV